MNKLYEATIKYKAVFETYKFFGIINKSYWITGEIDFPHIIYAPDKKAAESTVKLSPPWKTENLSEFLKDEYELEDNNFVLEKKEVCIKELLNTSVAELLARMPSVDFVKYIKNLISEIGI